MRRVALTAFTECSWGWGTSGGGRIACLQAVDRAHTFLATRPCRWCRRMPIKARHTVVVLGMGPSSPAAVFYRSKPPQIDDSDAQQPRFGTGISLPNTHTQPVHSDRWRRLLAKWHGGSPRIGQLPSQLDLPPTLPTLRRHHSARRMGLRCVRTLSIHCRFACTTARGCQALCMTGAVCRSGPS